MGQLLEGTRYDFMDAADKAFVAAFDGEMNRLGYTCEAIGDGYCWGRYMAIYTKAGVKSRKSYARLYLRDEDIVLRLYFSKIDEHRQAIERAPAWIQEAFTGGLAACEHCADKPECMHQKRYTLHGKQYEACDGRTFWFVAPKEEHMQDYIDLFLAFYPQRKRK